MLSKQAVTYWNAIIAEVFKAYVTFVRPRAEMSFVRFWYGFDLIRLKKNYPNYIILNMRTIWLKRGLQEVR